MDSENFLLSLDQLIQHRSILRHPFYLAWQRGDLITQQLANYATNYYSHVAAFPDYLRNAIACAGDPATTAALRQNLQEELTCPAPHPELWLDFAEAAGVSRSDLASLPPSPEASPTVATFHRLTKQSRASALAALYAYESQQPGVAAEKIRGLTAHYGISGERALRYFTVHCTADIEHRGAERSGLGRSLAAGAKPAEIMAAAETALDAYWGLLDNIWEAAA